MERSEKIRNIAGSPPLVRERHRRPRNKSTRRRITPARAGKTGPFGKRIGITWDHPRSCGKDSSSARCRRQLYGSPPLVRERHPPWPLPRAPVGITPARAGKTKSRLPFALTIQDHPRSCGKDYHPPSRLPSTSGSPPLVRERRRA